MGGLNHGVSRKLSKPRRNLSSLDLNYPEQPEPASSPLTPSTDMDYFGDHAAVINSQGERRSRRKSRTKLRAYLYGSPNESAQTFDSDDEEEGQQSGFAGAARGARKRMSRTGSSIMQLSSAKASTTYLSNGSSPRLLLLSDAEDTAITAEQIKEKAYQDTLAAQNHVFSPVDEDKHVDSVLAPLRRKSLYTPGIATRHPSDILRKPPPPQSIQSQADRDYYYNPAYPESSPLARLAAFGRPEDGRSTPSNLHITHLGGLQLGTLRVMNGTTSPVPQEPVPIIERRPLTPESATQDDFQIVPKGSCEDGSPPKHESAPLVAQSPQPKYQRSDSAAMANEFISVISGSPFSHPEDEAIHIPQSSEPDTNAGSTRADAFEVLDGNTPSIAESDRVSVPISFTAGCSQLVEEVPKTDSGYSSNSSLGSNVERDSYEAQQGSAQQDRHRDVPEQKPVRLSKAPRCVSVPREIPQAREPIVSTMEKPDLVDTVRQSSRVTSRGLAGKLQKRPKPQPTSANLITVQGYRELTYAHIPQVPSSIAAKHAERLDSFPLLEHTFPSLDHVTTTRSPPPKYTHLMPVRFPSPANALEAAAAVDYPAQPVDSKDKRRSLSRPRSLFRRSTCAVDDNEWGSSELVRSPSWSDFGGEREKKEQKRSEKASKDAERRLAKEEQALAKRLDKNKRNHEKQLKREEEMQKASRSRASSCMRGRSAERRRSSQYDVEATIADFGTVAESLGGSPYDIATSMNLSTTRDGSNKHPHQLSSLISRPKSMVGMDEAAASEYARARSRTRSHSSGKPNLTADEFPRNCEAMPLRKARPQTMFVDIPPVPALSAVDLRCHDLDWARNRQRSRSVVRTEDLVQAASNQTTNDSSRPQSMVIKAPPVPALPTSSQVQRREAQIRDTRPQSMIIDAQPMPSPSSSPPRAQRDGGRELVESITSQPICDSSTSRRSRSNSRAVPDLWSNGSLEKKTSKPVKETCRSRDPSVNQVEDCADPSPSDNVWEAQRQAWAQRRKSAGEALQLKKQLTEIFATSDGSHSLQMSRPQLSNQSVTAEPQSVAVVTEAFEHPSSRLASEPRSYETRNHEQQGQRDSQNDISSQMQLGPQLPTPAERRAQSIQRVPRKRAGSGTTTPTSKPASGTNTTFERISGRYDGGLLYGYEPGQGLGGSAGTRGARSEASRKSMDVSRGFGIDLSDIPIFVAPTPR